MPAIYESWDLSVPPVPPRTRLYPLEPIGLGTPFIESLTGYVLRLAEAHCLPVGALIGLELERHTFMEIPNPPAQNERNGCSCGQISYSANGVEESAVKWSSALERCTLRKGLHRLTFLAFGDFFCSLSLFRRLRTWCPACFEEWRISGETVYEPLLWSLKVVSVCPRHRERLISICPHCHRPMRPLTSFSCPGYCGRCNGWLGITQEGVARETVSEANSEYWVSSSAGELLALAPRDRHGSGILRHAFRENFEACIKNLFRGNGSDIAKFVGCTATSVYNWRNGATTPRIDQLLQLSERLRIPIGEFLKVRNAAGARDWKFIKPAASGYAPPTVRYRPAEETRRALELALRERPSPSLAEVARRLNYRGTEGLRRIGRSLCKRITDNYKRSFTPEPYYNGPRPRIRARKEIGAALKASLAQDDPESVPRIVALSMAESRRSLGMTMMASTSLRSSSRPASAIRPRWRPSKKNGLVTTATVRQPSSLAIRATIGETPLPVPPPSPQVTKTMLAPLTTSWISSLVSSAARRPRSVFMPVPRPRVMFLPRWMRFLVSERCRSWLSVLTAMKSTPRTLQLIM